MNYAETNLPDHLLKRATLRGKELAWSPSDIPEVIEAAEAAKFINIGGQLQFRFPDGGTCECYWVEVDTYNAVSADLPWQERVTLTATEALAQFRALQVRYDFLAEGRREFGKHIDEFQAAGGNPKNAMCFVWYVDASQDDSSY